MVVRHLTRVRGPALQAGALYEETDESRMSREAAVARIKLERPAALDAPGRPTKKDRRALAKWRRSGRQRDF